MRCIYFQAASVCISGPDDGNGIYKRKRRLRRREMFTSKKCMRRRFRGSFDALSLSGEILIPENSKPAGLRRASWKILKITRASK
jgi:hypothetical protein